MNYPGLDATQAFYYCIEEPIIEVNMNSFQVVKVSKGVEEWSCSYNGATGMALNSVGLSCVESH